MARRLVTDAKIVLRNAGISSEYEYERGQVVNLVVNSKGGPFYLPVNGGTVDNYYIENILNDK